MGTHRTEKDLEKLTSNIRYYNFEHDKGDCYQVPFYENVMGELESHPSLRPIYQKLVKALCYVYVKKVNDNNFESDLCSYMHYWIGDKVYSIIGDKSRFERIMNAFYDEFNNTNSGTICKRHNTSIDKDTFNKNKMLFDYSKNYKQINLNTVYGRTTCEEGYKNFIKQYIDKYNDAYTNCYQGDQKNYDCTYFHELFPKEEHKELTSFYCMQQNMPAFSTERNEGHQTTEHIISTVPTTEMNPNHVDRHDARNYRPKVYRDTQLNHISEAQRGLVNDISPFTDHTTEGGSSKTIAGSVVPVLGVSSISLLLYKVTPVGGFINKLLGRNRNMYNTIENMDVFNPYSDEMDPTGRRMNISYHRF
ncbi:VIR protein [Plasmodium vivax]|uniref:VIR protein n=1 Tax=Plasmodium vivax TaxID=5855 RepID=A0A1G4E6C9_PLAVI|nr:VIR protein [Plasmodium vivax]